MVHSSGREFGRSIDRRAQIYNNCMMANYERLTQLLAKMHQSEHVRTVESELNHISEDPLVVNLMAMAIADPNLPRTPPNTQTTLNWQPQSHLTAPLTNTFTISKNPI